MVSFPFLFAVESGVFGIILRYQDQAGVRVLGVGRDRYLVVPGGLRAPLRRGMVMEEATTVSHGMGAF